MYKSKKKEFFSGHLEFNLHGRNKYDVSTLDCSLGFDINTHFISIDLIFVGITVWWKV